MAALNRQHCFGLRLIANTLRSLTFLTRQDRYLTL